MKEIVPGAFHWTARHPKIGEDVSSYFIERSGTLIDPMLPAEGVEWFRDRPPRLIVLTIRHHLRDCDAFVREFGVEICCHERGLHEFEDGPAVRGFATGEELAPGIVPLELNAIAPDDVVLAIDAGGGALAFGDGLVNHGGRIGFVGDQHMDDPAEVKRATREAARGWLDRDFEHLFFAHGDPIVGDGRRRLEDFLQS